MHSPNPTGRQLVAVSKEFPVGFGLRVNERTKP